MLAQHKHRVVAYHWRTPRILKTAFAMIGLLALLSRSHARANDISYATTPFADVYVDWQNTSGVEDGSPTHPFNTVAEGVTAVSSGSTIIIRLGSYSETLTINRAMSLKSAGGTVMIGVSRPPPVYKIYLPQVSFMARF